MCLQIKEFLVVLLCNLCGMLTTLLIQEEDILRVRVIFVFNLV